MSHSGLASMLSTSTRSDIKACLLEQADHHGYHDSVEHALRRIHPPPKPEPRVHQPELLTPVASASRH